MFAVFAAEQQYHHDIRTRESERRILASMRERSTVIPQGVAAAPTPRVANATGRAARAAWPRPIGLHAHDECAAAVA